MKSLLYIGGPLLLFTSLAFWTDLFTFPSEEPGIVHFSGVPMGGLFQINTKYYECNEGGNNCVLVDETTEFTEVDGLEFETEEIEYREGAGKQYNKTRQPGLSKYTNIHLQNFGDYDFDFGQWKFEYGRERQDGSIFLLDEDVTNTDRLLETEVRQPNLPGPKTDEAAMENLELEIEELELEE